MGDEDGSDKSRRVVFLTVGTTCFDALVRAVDSENVKKELLAKGYTHLLVQMGRGSYAPTKVVSNIIPCFPSPLFF
jgi:beta-1,4-N-acetylglucosaminyltransferase